MPQKKQPSELSATITGDPSSIDNSQLDFSDVLDQQGNPIGGGGEGGGQLDFSDVLDASGNPMKPAGAPKPSPGGHWEKRGFNTMWIPDAKPGSQGLIGENRPDYRMFSGYEQPLQEWSNKISNWVGMHTDPNKVNQDVLGALATLPVEGLRTGLDILSDPLAFAGGVMGLTHPRPPNLLHEGPIPPGARDITPRPPEPLGPEQQLRAQPLGLPPSSRVTPQPSIPQAGPFVSGEAGIAGPGPHYIDFGTTGPSDIRVNQQISTALGKGRAPQILEQGATPNPPAEIVNVPPNIAAKYGTGLGRFISDESGALDLARMRNRLEEIFNRKNKTPRDEEEISFLKDQLATRVPPGAAKEAENAWPQKLGGTSNVRQGQVEPFPGVPGAREFGRRHFGPDEPNSINIEDITPQRMQVGKRNRKTGEYNVAMGGADPRVLDILGTSLYSSDRPSVVAKELLQNAVDEHNISGSKEPIRVLFHENTENPGTGQDAPMIAVRDAGRGVGIDDIYTVLTDIGKSGKISESSAAGGFGFAKAAPFLGGDYTRVTSVVDEGGDRVQYTFEGNPAQLKDQTTGVPVTKKYVSDKIPTGLAVQTWFAPGTDLYSARAMVRDMSQYSTSIKTPVKMGWTTSSSPSDVDSFIKSDNQGFINKYVTQDIPQSPYPPEQGEITTPGAKVKLSYHPSTGEHAGYSLRFMNKGLYQGYTYKGYGGGLPNVPEEIFADIIATVEEGKPGYPFTSNREQLNAELVKEIDKWVDDNVASGSKKSLVKQMQQLYSSIRALPGSAHNMGYYDEGARLTPDELAKMQNSKGFQNALEMLETVHQYVLAVADNLGWKKEGFGITTPPGWKPSDRLEKFGLLFQAPGAQATTLGIHIPNPGSTNKSTILVNLMEHLNDAMAHPEGTGQLATNLLTTIIHEIAHIPGGTHDTAHSYRDARLHAQLATRDTVELLDTLQQAFGSPDDIHRISPELQEILRVYNDSRQRPGTETSFLKTGINRSGRTNPPGGTGQDDVSVARGRSSAKPLTGEGSEGAIEMAMQATWQKKYGNSPEAWDSYRKFSEALKAGAPTEKGSQWNVFQDAYQALRAFKVGGDLSYILSQGRAYAFRPYFYKAFVPLAKALGGKRAYDITQNELKQDPWYEVGRQSGLFLADLKTGATREESIQSELPERFWLTRPYYRPLNRANTAFINFVRQKAFSSMMNASQALGEGLAESARRYANFVNTYTGRASGDFRFQIGQGRHGINLEKAVPTLGYFLNSPRFTFSRLKMFTLPVTDFMNMDNVERKEAFKNLFALATLALTGYGVTSLAGGKIGDDPTSSDWGKAIFGKTRFDLLHGMGQLIVLAAREIKGQSTSTRNLKTTQLGRTFGGGTRWEPVQKFIENKMHPTLQFAEDFLRAMSGSVMDPQSLQFNLYGRPYNMGLGGQPYEPSWKRMLKTPFENELAKQFAPMVLQDIYDVYMENPELLGPAAILSVLGQPEQTYREP